MKNQIVQESPQKKKWIKIPKTASLYRWGSDGNFYIRATVNGRAISESLETTDLAFAKKKVLERKEREKRVLAGGGNITLAELIGQFKISRNGKNAAMIKDLTSRILKTPELANKPISKIDGLSIAKWFTAINLNPSFNNQTVETLKGVLSFGVNQKYISENPMINLSLRKKVPKRGKVLSPTIEQFEKIRQFIKSNKFSDTAKQSYELFSFCGLFGCYEADAETFNWQDIDWEKEKITLTRAKTKVTYRVPIYPFAMTFLCELYAEYDKPQFGKVFQIKNVKRSLTHACKSLGYPHFTIIDFRRMFVERLIKKGVSAKKISEWIGHSDGGGLVLKLYSEVFNDNDTEYEKSQLAKLA